MYTDDQNIFEYIRSLSFPTLQNIFRIHEPVDDICEHVLRYFTEASLKRYVKKHYSDILDKQIKYSDLLYEKYLDFFHQYNGNNFYLYSNIDKYQEVTECYSITKLGKHDSKHFFQIQHLTTKEIITFYYENHRWCCINNDHIYLDDVHIYSYFIYECVKSANVYNNIIQITNTSSFSSNELISDYITISSYEPQNQFMVCKFSVHDKTIKTILGHLCDDMGDEIQLRFYLYHNKNNHINEFLLHNVRYNLKRDSSFPIFVNNRLSDLLKNQIFINNTEFITHYIPQYNFEQCIKKQKNTVFSLSSFYGTELFNIMSSYL